MPSAAVRISTASTVCMGSASIIRAPSGGATMVIEPFSAAFIPCTRPSSARGTMRDVDAFMAGMWKTPPIARTSIAR